MKKVILYSSPSCPHCRTAKSFLLKEGIPFVEKNVQDDAASYQEYQKLGVQGVPTFVIGDEVIVGFSAERVQAAIDFKVPQCPHCQAKMIVPKGKGKIRVRCPECQEQFVMNT